MMHERDPLPYSHDVFRGKEKGRPYACQLPEADRVVAVAMKNCPGCRAYGLAFAVAEPNTIVARTTSPGGRAVDVVRELLDEFDPMAVLFERALAERGIA